MRLVVVVLVLLSVAPSGALAAASSPAPQLAVLPFTGGSATPGTVAYVQEHLEHWIRRWGQPLDGPTEIEARLGADGLRQLYATRGVYAAVLTGELKVIPDEWTVVLSVTALADGTSWVETTVTEPSLRELLDALVATSQYIAETVSRRTGRPVVEYVPSTRAYAPVTFPSAVRPSSPELSSSSWPVSRMRS